MDIESNGMGFLFEHIINVNIYKIFFSELQEYIF